MSHNPSPLGERCLSLLLLVAASFQLWQAKGQLSKFPMNEYCGVGVCSTEVANHLQTLADSASALVQAQAAVRFNTASPYAWADLAEIYLRLGRSDEAYDCFQQALQSAPLNAAIRLRATRSLSRSVN